MLPRPSSHPLTTVILSQEVLRNIFAFKLFIYSFLNKKKKKKGVKEGNQDNENTSFKQQIIYRLCRD